MAREADKRRSAERRGRRAERLAAFYLRLKGYRILTTRFKCHAGEIDIVARKGDLAIFVEVKARRSEQLAIDAVTASAQRRIRSASDIWLSRQADAHRLSQRYDIIACLPGRLPLHFPGAF
ncbi:YraN family protein [uncultured Martelella sp.]|uniref:YraN family protein n=1 Tax=uncultured Martelella sp. TaxID=392331 RepID=UPI0029C98E5B|nr:YraN family protein [uncultured Martelella sp.]